MRLKELEIQGFKSFPDRTRITVEPGVTAVVGPNGSGKSNLSDAIRWVLGENSSKQLRGTGKMEDVIFGGTETRGAMGFASVRLTLDNSDHSLDMEADEVIVGRRFYRSGESSYTINGKTVRQRDIYELLLNTGLGRDGYAAVGQGRVAEIVGAKSNERREIFEEASGIARFRFRKTEAERRLASAEANLVRLRDIVDELARRVGPLEKESEKAKRFLSLSEERRSAEVTLWVENIYRAKDTVRDQQRRYETAEADYHRLEREEREAEQEAEDIRAASRELTIRIERMNGEIRSITEELGRNDSRIAVLEAGIARNGETAAGLQKEIEEGQRGTAAIQEEMEQHRQAAAALNEKIAGLEIQIADTARLLEELAETSQASGQRKGILQARLTELTGQQTESRVAAAAAAASADSARQRLEQGKADLESGSRDQAVLEQRLTDAKAALDEADGAVTRLSNMKNGLELKLKGRKAALETADAAEQQLGRELDGARQRLNVLRELEKNMDGYQQSVKSIMQAARSQRLRGIIGPVSSILQVDKGYETAIETALGYSAQNLVVENETAAKAAIAFLRETRGGRATFLPLDTVQPGKFTGSLSGSACVAAELVSYDSRYENIVSNLLGRIIVVDEINEASGVAKRLGYRNKIVTADGQQINAGGSFTGGSVSRAAGIFTRKQEMEELRRNIEKGQKKLEQAQENTDRAQQAVKKLQAEYDATANEAVTAQSDRIRAEMEVRQLTAAVQAAAAARQALETELEEQKQRWEQDSETARRESEREQSLAGEISALEQELGKLSGDDDNFLSTRTRLSDQLSQRKLEKLSAQKDVALHEAGLESLRLRTGETANRRTDLERSIAELQRQSVQNQSELDGIRAEKQRLAGEITAREQAIETAAAARLQKEAEESKTSERARTLGDDKERMSQEMARLAERRSAAETEYDQTIAKLWEEYQLGLTEAQGLCVEFESMTALRARVQELRNKIRALGNVNVSAIDEYKEVSARYNELNGQVQDVEKSRKELLKMIDELGGEMEKLFRQNFAEINRNFGVIFRELFGGGHARLYLENEQNVLESGIEIEVSPPGKVIKSLSALSGGEQSLVAICIYFAILAVNPSPFCVLDEIEAALDDVNVARFAQYLHRISDKTQFIVISHRRGTMEAADILYGVTMQEDGVSKVLRLDLEHVDASLVS